MSTLTSEEALKNLYQETLSKLKKGERPLYYLEEEELSFCTQYWMSLNEKNAPESDYMALLCILDHAKKGSLELLGPLTWVLKNRKEKDLLIYVLNAGHRVILEECERQGERIPFAFIEALKPLLDHKEPEVLEWTLRTIEALGHQSIILKEDVLRARPGILSFLNEHKKNSQELVDYLMRRWGGSL